MRLYTAFRRCPSIQPRSQAHLFVFSAFALQVVLKGGKKAQGGEYLSEVVSRGIHGIAEVKIVGGWVGMWACAWASVCTACAHMGVSVSVSVTFAHIRVFSCVRRRT
jgi:hypothetical protein